jgi:hypothetical protein
LQLSIPKGSQPYRVQSILQSPLLRLTTDKISHNFHLFFTTILKSGGVMENITFVCFEDNFVLDAKLVVELDARSSHQPSPTRMSLPNLYVYLERWRDGKNY